MRNVKIGDAVTYRLFALGTVKHGTVLAIKGSAVVIRHCYGGVDYCHLERVYPTQENDYFVEQGE